MGGDVRNAKADCLILQKVDAMPPLQHCRGEMIKGLEVIYEGVSCLHLKAEACLLLACSVVFLI